MTATSPLAPSPPSPINERLKPPRPPHRRRPRRRPSARPRSSPRSASVPTTARATAPTFLSSSAPPRATRTPTRSEASLRVSSSPRFLDSPPCSRTLDRYPPPAPSRSANSKVSSSTHPLSRSRAPNHRRPRVASSASSRSPEACFPRRASPSRAVTCEASSSSSSRHRLDRPNALRRAHRPHRRRPRPRWRVEASEDSARVRSPCRERARALTRRAGRCDDGRGRIDSTVKKKILSGNATPHVRARRVARTNDPPSRERAMRARCRPRGEVLEHGVAVPASMSFARLVDGVKALPVRISLSVARRLPTRRETRTTTTTRRVVFARATSPALHGSTDDATRA